MKLEWICKDFDALSSLELYKIIQLRINVFMLEQNCFYPDCDDKDLKGKHLYAVHGNDVVSYARLLPAHVSYSVPSIGRVVVRKDLRKEKIGFELMQKAIARVRSDFPAPEIRISAQAHLQNFYQNLGFMPEGEIYLEDDIPHIEMILKNKEE